LLGIQRRIARGAERLGAEPRGRLMVLSAAGAIGPEPTLTQVTPTASSSPIASRWRSTSLSGCSMPSPM